MEEDKNNKEGERGSADEAAVVVEHGSEARDQQALTTAPGFTKVEKSLASLGFFTPSSRRIKQQRVKRIEFTREVEGKRVEVSAEIHPSGVFGLPVTADQDKYLALQKIITRTMQAEGKIANPIRFKSADLLRLLNDNTKSGKNYKDISEWLDVMSSTTIISNGAAYAAGQKRFVRDRFRVFDRAVSVGRELEDGTVADANYVWLSSWQLENINKGFLLPIDLETYRELKNHIAKALVPLLQVWLFATHKTGSFEKRYNELCEILTLQVYRAPSHILRQLKPSLDELTQHEYLSKWRIEKTSDRKAYKVVFFHGPKFHRDRRRRLEEKREEEPVVVGEYTPTEPKMPEPGKLEQTAAPGGNRGESEGKLVDELAARGLVPSAALNLLAGLSPERLAAVTDYIEYWDSLRARGDVGPGLLYKFIKDGQPLPAGFETSRRREGRREAEEWAKRARQLDEDLEKRYAEYCREALNCAIAETPAEEFERRVMARYQEITAGSEFFEERPEVAKQLAEHDVRAEIGRTIALPSLEEFKQQNRATAASPEDEVPQAGEEPHQPDEVVNQAVVDEEPEAATAADGPEPEGNAGDGSDRAGVAGEGAAAAPSEPPVADPMDRRAEPTADAASGDTAGDGGGDAVSPPKGSA